MRAALFAVAAPVLYCRLVTGIALTIGIMTTSRTTTNPVIPVTTYYVATYACCYTYYCYYYYYYQYCVQRAKLH